MEELTVGHGTHVSSIAAGTGDRDPGIQTGFAPSAVLVGVKVLGPSGGSFSDLEDGFQWLYNNIDNFSIDVVNISLGTHEDLADCQDIIDLINDIKDEGVSVFVSAGNEGDGYDGNAFLGHYYDTLSTFAENTSTSIGSIKNPYEGGWGLSAFSSRGIVSDGPYIVAPGENIRAAEAGTSIQCRSFRLISILV